MVEPTSNDNEVSRPSDRNGRPDPHGHAAILLVESLIHGLIERSLLSVPEAVEIVEAALEVKEEISEEIGDAPAALAESRTILSAIRESLIHDLSDGHDGN